MITTAVQQASQMVEVQGPPITVQADGNDFRETFTANVSAPVGQRLALSQSDAAPGASGSSPNRPAAGAALLVKSAPTSSLLKVKDQTASADAEDQAIESAASNLKSGSELALKDTESGVARDGSDLRRAVLTPAADEAPQKTSGFAAAVGARSAQDVARDADVIALKADDLSKSLEGDSAKAHKPGASGPGKEAGSAKSETIASADADLKIAGQSQLNASLIIPLPQAAGDAIAQKGSEPAVLTSALQGDPAAITQRKLPAPPGGQTADGAAGLAGAGGAGAAQSFAGEGTAFLAALDRLSSLRAKDADTQSVPATKAAEIESASDTKGASELKSIEPTAAGHSAEAVGTAVPQAASLAVVHPGPSEKPPRAAQPHASAAIAGEQGLPAQIQGSEPGVGSGPAIDGPLLPASEAAFIQGGPNPSLTLGIVREAAPVSASLRAAPVKLESAAAKDGKTKPTVDGDASASSSVPTTSTVTPSVSLTSSATTSAATAVKVTPSGDAATLATQVLPHVTGVTAHGADGGAATVLAAPTLTARIQGTAGTAAAAEPASSGAQVGESHRTLLATPTTLEVGMQSGTQGWLRIRAEVGDQGAVNASLAAGTSGGRELLHSQMPALNAFLHGEQMAVTTTVVERGALAGGAFGSGGLGSTGGSGSNGSLLQGGGAQSGESRQESFQQAVSSSANETVRSYDAQSGASGAEGSSSGRASVSEESGRWLNVRV